MPLLVRVFVRTALLWQGLGFCLGGLVLAEKGLSWLPWVWTLHDAHIHILLVGWLVRLAARAGLSHTAAPWEG